MIASMVRAYLWCAVTVMSAVVFIGVMSNVAQYFRMMQ